MKRIKSGFTIVELLTVVAIMALLVGVLLPALTYVRTSAKEAQQKVQLATIDLALTTFKNDYGDYPPSDSYSHDTAQIDYCGAQKLAEALLGRDLLGFHPRSNWSATYTTWYPLDPNESNLRERKGPYLELATAGAFRLGVVPNEHDGLFDGTGVVLDPDPFVLCDVFSIKKITVVNQATGKSAYFNAGTPILYFRANTASKSMFPPSPIYNVKDNEELIKLKSVKDGKDHFPGQGSDDSKFIEYIMDLKASTLGRPWPYRPDSYILISAGADGLYGTADDITNF